MELRYKHDALGEFETYLRWYEKVFADLYSDTGIRDELKIIQEHKDQAVHLKVEIIRAVHDALLADPVIGRKKKGKLFELCFYVGMRFVVVYYTEDKREKIRWVESLSIGRKPNLF